MRLRQNTVFLNGEMVKVVSGGLYTVRPSELELNDKISLLLIRWELLKSLLLSVFLLIEKPEPSTSCRPPLLAPVGRDEVADYNYNAITFPRNISNLMSWKWFWKTLKISRQEIRITEFVICKLQIVIFYLGQLTQSSKVYLISDISWHQWHEMTEPIVRHGGILCTDLQVKTRHSWIHQVHWTRNSLTVQLCWWQHCLLSRLQSQMHWKQLSCHSSELCFPKSLNLIWRFSLATYTDCGPGELMLGW